MPPPDNNRTAGNPAANETHVAAPEPPAIAPSPAAAASVPSTLSPTAAARRERPQRIGAAERTPSRADAPSAAADRPDEVAEPRSGTRVAAQAATQPARKFPTLAAMMTAGAPQVSPAADLLSSDVGAETEPELDEAVRRFEPRETVPPSAREDTQPAPIAISRVAAAAAAGPQSAARATGSPLAARRSRPRPLPAVDPIPPLAGVQVAVAVCGALSGAALLVVGRPAGWWPLTLAAIAGIGGWLASIFAPHPRRAGAALLVSQVFALGWVLALAGPRGALLVVAALIVLVALWLCGRGVAATAAAAVAALYVAAVMLSAAGALHPALVLDTATGAVVDGAVSCLALLLMLRLALRLHTAAAKAEALAAARSFELDVVRGRTTALRREVERDAERLRLALREAQTGAPAPTVNASGALSPLADEIDVTAARLHALHRDRQQRRELERAVYRLVRALERAWLGLPWEWPEASGTKLDDVVALLRSPNPREIARAHLDDASGLLPIPTLDAAHTPPWAPPQPHPLAPLAEPEPLWSSGELRATFRNSSQNARQPGLPWDEWDDWRGWDASEEE